MRNPATQVKMLYFASRAKIKESVAFDFRKATNAVFPNENTIKTPGHFQSIRTICDFPVDFNYILTRRSLDLRT
jgi:hypothetical protein